MKVVVAHNRYASGQPSGENVIVDAEIDALRAAGVTVLPYLRSSDEIGALPPLRKALLPVSPMYNRWTARELAALLDAEHPDVLHLHNPYPLISPWVIRVAHRAGVPVVQTVHNYRQVCSSGLYFRDGGICTDCRGRVVGWPAVRHACYRGSRPQSAVMAATLAVHRGTWRGVERYLALTGMIADHLRDYGIEADRITVKPNAVPDPGPPAALPAEPVFLFAARLVPEKGVRLLLDAWTAAAPAARLRIAGDGPMRAEVETFTAGRDDVDYLGQLTPAGMSAARRDASCVVVASTWHDVLPTVAIEGLAAGRPVLGTALGGTPWIVGDAGWTVDADAASMAAGFARAVTDLAGPAAAALAGRARQRYVDVFAPDTLMPRLIGVYEELHEQSRARSARRGRRGPAG